MSAHCQCPVVSLFLDVSASGERETYRKKTIFLKKQKSHVSHLWLVAHAQYQCA